MALETIVSPDVAAAHLQDPRWVYVDCRFTLSDPHWGETEYARSHLAGAVYAHLDRDLSGPVEAGVTGRHPLPDVGALAATLGRMGIDRASQVVAYDASTGAVAAARLWWLLKWVGHDAVAVLDGGFQRWTAAGLPCAAGVERRPARGFEVRLRPQLVVGAGQVMSIHDDPAWALLDVRSTERFHGKDETLDPVAGHIPGARSAPYTECLRPDGTLKEPRELARHYEPLVAGRDASHTVFYCGSGVTAAHAVLSHAHAGRGMARLYAGSWSEWITDPRRPIATE